MDRWRRRLRLAGRVVTAVVLLALLVDLLAGLVTGRQVKRQVAALAARGQPVTVEQMAPPPAPPEENAAPLYLQALRAAPQLGRLERALDSGVWRLPPARRAALLARYQPALALTRLAAARPQCRFEVDWGEGPWLERPYLQGMRTLVGLLAANAAARGEGGDRAGAWADMTTALRVCRHLQEEPTQVGQLRYEYALLSALEGLRDLIEAAPPSRAQAAAVTALLDPAAVRDGMRRAVSQDRAVGLSWLGLLQRDPARFWQQLSREPEKTPSPALLRVAVTLAAPAINRQIMEYLRVAAEGERLLGPVGSAIPARDWRRAGNVEIAGWAVLAQVASPSYRMLDTTAEITTGVTLARWALALSLYRQRAGQYPAELAAAAGELPAAPGLDPLSGTRPCYRRHAGVLGDRVRHRGDTIQVLRPAPYVLYGVGMNGQDNGGYDPPARLHRQDLDDVTWYAAPME